MILINTGLLTNLLSITKRNVICGVAGESKEGLEFLKKCIETGNFDAVIDRVYPLEKTAEAHKYVDIGHKKGNVVISMEHKET
ncbi:MAG: zinc-binding dehydrogenase [Candidatus Polarisedimenticolaceae bacterium]|nr:zinc-binding dehydrogenase [Candidatus Polarisedimenticolaceae bacterium]